MKRKTNGADALKFHFPPTAMPKRIAAYYCGLSVRSFERLVATGRIRPRRVAARTIVYLRWELDEYLAGLPAGGGETPTA
ncbi:helix-turn-helix transcriptional regulator [Aporhodopirellula aestuarii]|uniref:Helix-turn-helix domain-containing protein n=1 Tax=Aporhodopirellula aestuarii TaxID=2950107 RepID=A0ABT0U3B9_9BACT|nr:helix-turn-helix domain-containing protein [Aporhodopirellula aestuarii]MCM2371096.1 helix-turn-helix domain-containing protein [Aporhodopirellula aestuarii]